jgi:FAD/FMN-containing dehydrogenase
VARIDRAAITSSRGMVAGVSDGHALRTAQLEAECPEFVHVPGDPAYDSGRAAWNLAAQQRPAAVALPRSVDDVSRLVRAANRAGLRVAAQNTGHAASTLVARGLGDIVLVRLGALDGVYVDAANRTARVEGGAVWRDVVAAAAPHGLTGLHGSSPHVGVTGYTLGGGLSFYARKHGLAANSVVGVEIVTADGDIVRADERTNPDLFWAVRGGGGNFGIVTALEFRLHPIADAYAGMLLWEIGATPEVVPAWAEWCRTAPEEVTTSLRIMRFPPLPHLPEFLRGRSLVIIDGAALLDDDAASEALAPLRALAPEMDTFGRIPAAGVTEMHMDPVDPVPAAGAGAMLARLDDDAVEAFLAAVGPGVETPVFVAELRQLGGALAQPVEGGGALSHLAGSHAAMFIAMAPTPEMAVAGDEAVAGVVAALAAWSEGRNFPNFSDRPIDPASAYEPDAWARLRRVKAAVDPDGLFLANHEIRGEA